MLRLTSLGRQPISKVCYTRCQVSLYLGWIKATIKHCEVLQYYVQESRFVEINLKIKCTQNVNEVETKDFERSSYLVKLWVSRHHLHWSELLLRYSVSILMNADFLRFSLWIQYIFVWYGSICICTIQLSIGREDTRENSFSSNHCLHQNRH